MKRILIVLLAMFMLVCGTQAAFAKRIIFANEGFPALTGLYIHHVQQNHTSANLLRGNTLYQAFGALIDFTPLTGWNVIVDTSNGQRYTWNNVDFTNVDVMFLFPDRAEYQ